ncbi:lipoprotein [Salmonella enterica subsp. enterica]|nr:lipoprotein [Salmonella enterica subsp. enterica]
MSSRCLHYRRFENQFTPTTVWSTSVGNGIGEFYSNLHPVMADNVVYAADRAGVVKALNADDGKEIWSVNLGEKDGWFSRSSALLSGRRHCRGRSRLYRQ